MSDGTDRRVPVDLEVEYESEPINVDPEMPRFSWRVDADGRGSRQTAYRVLVARSRAAALDGNGECWDSERVESARSANVAYDGAPLSSDETYYWTVRVWDETGTPTGWADPVPFSTALGSGSEWAGEWIGYQPGPGDSNGFRTPWRSPDESDEEWVQVDLGESRSIAAVELHPATPFDGLKTPDGWTLSALDAHEESEHVTVTAEGPAGFGIPRRYRIEVSDDPSFNEATVLSDRTDEDRKNPGSDPVVVETDAAGRFVRVTATGLYAVDPFDDEDPFHGPKADRMREEFGIWRAFALAALAVRGPDGRDLAFGGTVSASSSAETETWGRTKLVDGSYESALACSSPLLRRETEFEKPIERARAHVAGLGYGELYVNGEKIGDRVLDPGWTQYDERVLYSTYDLTDLLQEGDNALGLWLGRGWFSKNFYEWTGFGSPRARLHLVVEFVDGTTRTIGTDTSWRAAPSPIVENDLYDGEVYDAREKQDSWANSGFDDSTWEAAAVVSGPGGDLVPQRIEPIRVVETVEPVEILERDDGPIVDFGQNLTGWCKLTVAGLEAGDRVEITHAEALTEDGELSTVDLRSAQATDTYVAGDDGCGTYEPRFTYHGFRYAQVSGLPDALTVDDIVARVVHTDTESIGSFDCSNEELTQVQENAEWGFRGNLHSVPTDCPQRDERFGWTGDGRWTARPRILTFDMVRSFEKWMDDHDDAQSRHGYVSDSVPYGFGVIPEDASWALTRVSIPWLLYEYYGDRQVLTDHYEGMSRYVDFWHSVAQDGVVPAEYGNYGDWLAFENTGGNVGLPLELFNTATLIEAIETFARIAEVLGHDADAAAYRERRRGIVEGFNKRFFDDDAGHYDPYTQAAQAVPLWLGIVPEGREESVLDALVRSIRANNDSLRTGFVSTPALLASLSRRGHHDLAYAIVSQPEQPGWVYMVRQGATTMWEHWDSDSQIGSGMNSLNHPSFGSVVEWFIESLVGLRPASTDRDPPHLEVVPGVVEDLDWAEASMEHQHGEFTVRWEHPDDRLVVETTIPWNSTATVSLPDGRIEESGESIREDGRAASSLPDGVTAVRSSGAIVDVEVGTGTYCFRVDESG